MSAVVDQIAALFEREGAEAYLGEPVSIAEHMLQTAFEAELAGAPNELVSAALLHDIGHLVHGMAHDAAEHGIDTVHEEAGARWLKRAFGPAVTEPIRLHVAAKQYLCAVENDYLAVLSPASVHSLVLQGGPFTPDAAAEFRARPHADDAVRVRRWDDAGKIAGRVTPDFDHFRAVLETCLTES
jgi:gamma-butyrobetaine dioxygenase